MNKVSSDQRQLWIIPQNAPGFGDIACALKIGNFLVDKGFFQENNVFIISANTEIVSLFNSHALQVIAPEDVQKIHITSINQLLKFVVPIRNYNNINCNLLKGQSPCIILWEYGITNSPVPAEISGVPHLVGSLGLEIHEKGILIDQDLEKCGDIPWKQRLLLLEKIPFELRKAILGECELEKAAEEFIAHSRLYFGYAVKKESFSKFLKAVVNYNQGNTKNLVFVFPVGMDKIQLPDQLANVASIQLLAFDKMNGAITLKETKVISPEGKKVTIIIGTLAHHDLKWIQAASKKESMVTGDQSLSQAISAIFCRFVYETLPHKVELANSLNKYYPVGPALKVIEGKEAPKTEEFISYFERCKQQKKQFHEASRNICLNSNAFNKIPSLIEDAFKMSGAFDLF